MSLGAKTISEGELAPDLSDMGPVTIATTDVLKETKQDWLESTREPVYKKVSRR